MKHPNEAQLLLIELLRETGYDWIPECKLVAGRKWAYDWACAELRLAIELHGGTWVGGRHTRGAGFQNDRHKMNAAQILAWNVLEFTTEDVLRGRAQEAIQQWLTLQSGNRNAARKPKSKFLEVRRA